MLLTWWPIDRYQYERRGDVKEDLVEGCEVNDGDGGWWRWGDAHILWTPDRPNVAVLTCFILLYTIGNQKIRSISKII